MLRAHSLAFDGRSRLERPPLPYGLFARRHRGHHPCGSPSRSCAEPERGHNHTALWSLQVQAPSQ